MGEAFRLEDYSTRYHFKSHIPDLTLLDSWSHGKLQNVPRSIYTRLEDSDPQDAHFPRWVTLLFVFEAKLYSGNLVVCFKILSYSVPISF